MNGEGDIASPIFVLHIPKTAGSTLNKSLYASLHHDMPKRPSKDGYFNFGIYHYPGGFYKDPPGYVPAYRNRVAKLRGVRAVLGHYSYGLHKIVSPSARHVTILRHPVDRLISLYLHHQAIDVLRKDVDLKTFVLDCPVDGWNATLSEWDPSPTKPDEAAVREASRAIVDNDQVRRISGEEPPFGECDDRMLVKAKQHLRESFDVVGTTDRFDETVLLVADRFGLSSSPLYLPRLINRARSAFELRSDERRAIEERNALDLELYRFASESLASRIDAAGEAFQVRLSRFRSEISDYIDANADAIADRSL